MKFKIGDIVRYAGNEDWVYVHISLQSEGTILYFYAHPDGTVAVVKFPGPRVFHALIHQFEPVKHLSEKVLKENENLWDRVAE